MKNPYEDQWDFDEEEEIYQQAEEALADGYQMLEELGSGSFGVVYKAIEKASGEIVAVKCVRPQRALHKSIT
jgi:serine/threonine protein kinase